MQAKPGFEGQLVRQDGARIAGADNGHAPLPSSVSLAGAGQRLTHGAHGQADPGQADQPEHEVHDNHAARRGKAGTPYGPDNHRRARTEEQGVKHAGQIGGAEESQQGGELMEQPKEDQLQGDQPKQNHEPLVLVLRLHHEVEAQFVGEPKAGGQLDRVEHQEQPDTDGRRIVKEV